MKKKAELFTADNLIDLVESLGKELDYKVDTDIDYDIENVATISFSNEKDNFLTVIINYGGVENKIKILDKKDNIILEQSIRADRFNKNDYQDIINKIEQQLNKNLKYILNTPEKIYDYGEENDWKGLGNKHYEILSQDTSLAQMAVADMQDKGIVVPDILKKFRRYSMSFKELVVSKIARNKKEIAKKATEEDLDVKLKVQKNKPAGLDTSSPKSLPESIRPMVQDLKGKLSDVKEIEAELAARKAELDAKYQQAKDESKIVEKQAEIENLTQNIGKLLFAAKNETFQFQDNLVALTHQVKSVPAKATDKWKFEKVFAKLKELMGDANAQKFLDNTLNGLQSQATEKVITELNIFSPTQKQMKTSDTSDTNKFIDALKEIYVNLRNYYLDVKKANNIIEEQLATGATASKTTKVEKKAEQDLVENKWYFIKGIPYELKFVGNAENGKLLFQDRLFHEYLLDKNTELVDANRKPMDEESFKALWDWSFTNKAMLKHIIKIMFPEDVTAFSKWIQDTKSEEEIKALNERIDLFSSKKINILRKANKMNKKAYEDYVTEEDVLFEMMEDFEIFTPGEIEVGIAVGGRNLETAETMLFSRTGLRSLTQLKDDLRNTGTDQETLDNYVVGDTEDTEIESKKKVNLKKAKVNKKATVSLEMEIDDYIELLKNEYETSPKDWKTRGSRMLMNDFYEYMENFDGGKVKQPSEVMDNFLINGSFCERATDFTADGEWSNKFKEYNGNWEEFCENEAVIYNEDAACTNLGF